MATANKATKKAAGKSTKVAAPAKRARKAAAAPAAEAPKRQPRAAKTDQVAEGKALARKAQKQVPQGGKVAGKEVVVERAAILPIVDAKTKQVFLKVMPKSADEANRSAIATSIEEQRFTGLGNELKAFAKEHPDARVWSSKSAVIKASSLEKSVGTQLEFWQRSGFTVTNLKQMVEEAKAMASKTVKAKQAAGDADPAAPKRAPRRTQAAA